jgi:hypothetical protein
MRFGYIVKQFVYTAMPDGSQSRPSTMATPSSHVVEPPRNAAKRDSNLVCEVRLSSHPMATRWTICTAGLALLASAAACGARTSLEVDVDAGARGGRGGGTAPSRVVLFGGDDTADDAETVTADTWTWDGTAWTQQFAEGPPAREAAVMATLDGKIVLFGGATPYLEVADTWTWDGTAWNQLPVTSPSARDTAMMAPLGGQLVLFGGFGSTGALADTWTWDGAVWTSIAVSGPSARQGAVMAPLGEKLVLFGGHDASLAFLADTWTWDGGAWTQLDVAGPPGRDAATMAPLDGKLVLFGGFDAAGPLADTWTWDGTSWTQIDVTGPPARQSAAVAPLDGKLVLFGGNGVMGAYFGQSLEDTWTWDGTAWDQLDVAGPSARGFAVMASQ